MRKLLIAGFAVASLAGGSARAADMPVRMPPPVPVFSWTGFYLGANVGYGWREEANYATNVTCPAVLFCFYDRPQDLALVSGLGTGSGSSGRGITGGFQGGYNYQLGAFVVGAEADWSYFSRNSVLSNRGFDSFGAIVSLTNETQSSWLATFRGRLGWAADRILIYATGGGAVTDLRYVQTINAVDRVAGLAQTAQSAGSTTQGGWTVGGGAEFAPWDHLSVRAEYLYVHFNGVSQTFNFTVPGFNPNLIAGSSGAQNNHIVRVGLNYLFGSGGAVVARY
ncbi:MAG: outer membrane protein [Xanthobacteraceae bacterium]